MNQIGEKAFLKAVLPTLNVDPMFVNAFGHDASVLDLGLEQNVAFKIDRAPYPVALRHRIGDVSTWGRLAVVANVSDLLAVGAQPRALMLSLVLPGDFDQGDASAIIKGCEEACSTHGIAFVGGDTKEGPSPQVVGAALGTVEKGAQIGRCLAVPGDHLFVAGRLGAFAGSIALLEAGLMQHAIDSELIEVLTKPTARMAEGKYLRQSRMVAAACDLSDGLMDALDLFCGDTTGITLQEDLLPMHPLSVRAADSCRVPLWRFALAVGDWAIACVVREADAEAFRLARPEGIELAEVGRFNATREKTVRDHDGAERKMPNIVNEQFRMRIEDNGGYMQDLLRRQ